MTHCLNFVQRKIIDKLGLRWAKLSSNWSWNFVLLHLRFVALNQLDYIIQFIDSSGWWRTTSLIVVCQLHLVRAFWIASDQLDIFIARYSQLQLVLASGQLLISWTPSLIVLVEYTNSPCYTILIRLEIAEIAIASYKQLQLVVASGQLAMS